MNDIYSAGNTSPAPRRRVFSPLAPRAPKFSPRAPLRPSERDARRSTQAPRPAVPGTGAMPPKPRGASDETRRLGHRPLRNMPHNTTHNNSSAPLVRNKNSSTTGGQKSTRSRHAPSRAPRQRRGATGALTHRKSLGVSASVPPVPENGVRVVPLGGVEEVGKNMIVVETEHDLIISDAGFQFISDEETPGVDYVLPNTTYLEERKEKIRALFITHGHLDHIGGIPFIMERIGNPPLYTSELTSFMIKKRQEEFPHLPPLDIHVLKRADSVRLGDLRVRTFPVTHSIPDSCGLIIETPQGNVVISGDLKLDHDGEEPALHEKEMWGAIGKERNVLLIADSTNAEKSGFSIPEQKVFDTLEDIIKNAQGRLIIGTFASQFERMIKIIEFCEKYGKKIVTEGRSMKTNLEIAVRAERLVPKKETMISAEEMGNFPSDKIVILATGAQGEEFGALMRIATGKHRSLTFNERDTVVLSSSVIPGNELSVQKLKDNLYRHGLRIIHYRASDVHSTGHGNTGELVWIREQVKPRYLMPAYGYHSMLRCHAQANIDAGFPRECIIIPDNGTIVDIGEEEELIIREEKAQSSMMYVDGFSIGGMQEVVIRDRKTLAQDGMFVIIATLNLKTGKLRKSPDIISRGFVYLRESQELLGEARTMVKNTVEKTTQNMYPINFESVKNEVTDAVSRFLLEKTNKRPIVIPVVLGI